MMMSLFVAVLAVVSCFGTIVGTSSTDCPTPIAPENGEYVFYQGGMTVKYSCNPGYRLVGKTFVNCQNSEWSSEAPQCLPNTDASAVPSSKEGGFKEKITYFLTPLTRKTQVDTATDKSEARAAVPEDDDGVQSDEASRQMYDYITAHNYYYRRQPVVDPYYAAVSPYALSDNQINWINSLQPEVRDQYLKDVYNVDTRHASQLLRSYDAYRHYYGYPYYYYYNYYYNMPY